MPRVTFVKKAQKDNPVCKKGESYYWWKFRYGGKRYSLTRPRGSQLTQSAYYSTIRSIAEEVEDTEVTDPSDLDGIASSAADQLRDAGQECMDNRENMPESLQESDSGMLLEERNDTCEAGADQLESMDFSFTSELDEDDEDVTDEDREQELQDWVDATKEEILEAIYECEV